LTLMFHDTGFRVWSLKSLRLRASQFETGTSWWRRFRLYWVKTMYVPRTSYSLNPSSTPADWDYSVIIDDEAESGQCSWSFGGGKVKIWSHVCQSLEFKCLSTCQWFSKHGPQTSIGGLSPPQQTCWIRNSGVEHRHLS
jgi:hypothetical protein